MPHPAFSFRHDPDSDNLRICTPDVAVSHKVQSTSRLVWLYDRRGSLVGVDIPESSRRMRAEGTDILCEISFRLFPSAKESDFLLALAA